MTAGDVGAHALLIDFGSTYTKLRVVDLKTARVVGAGQGPSTVTTDVTIGFEAALADLERHMGKLPPFKHRLACSSAAGGLRMVTVGLVRELTAEAARQAALGAGAKLVGTFAYKLTEGDVQAIVALAPDILLLAGGTDGGNDEVILHNAAKLAAAPLACPIIVAGNRQAADAIGRLFRDAGKLVMLTENVMPEFNVLNIEPARAAIRQTFIDRIVHAKGIDRAAAMFDSVLMPTPAAVLDGARLLADGHGDRPGLGPLLVVDVGGATTDVHSVASGEPSRDGVVYHGLPEPYVKRTVEGDLGMRHNVHSIVEAAGLARIAADAGVPREEARAMVDVVAADVDRLPASDAERAFDRALARAAVKIAVTRHCGVLSIVHTATGPVTMQRGKDLSEVKVVIGTGGPLAHGEIPASILEGACADTADPFSLRPRQPRLAIDKDYALFACGLLASVEPGAALTMGLSCLHSVTKGKDHERITAA